MDADDKTETGGSDGRKRKADSATGGSSGGSTSGGSSSAAFGPGSSGIGFGGGGGGDDQDPKRPRSSTGSNQNDTGVDLGEDSSEEENDFSDRNNENEEPDLEGIPADAHQEVGDQDDNVGHEPGIGDKEQAHPDDEEENGSVIGSSNPESVAGSSASARTSRSTEGKIDWLSYKELMATTYPSKSQKLYLAAFGSLESYLKSTGNFDPKSPPDELSILNYFHHLRTVKGWVATTLWSHFSRVNAVMKRVWSVNLTIYPRLSELLKGYETGHRVKKSSVFTPQQARIAIVIPSGKIFNHCTIRLV